MPAFGVTIGDFERLRDDRLRAGGHHLRLGAQRLEAGRELRPRRLHRDHPRQALPRGDQGDREPGDEVPGRPLPRRARHGRGAARLRLHRGTAATRRRSPRGSPRRSRRASTSTRDLARVGVANQTTMLSGESLAIAEEFRREHGAALRRRGARREHFRSFDTICSATQERQDAVLALLEEPLDVMVVVGGYNSSNTCHLAALVQSQGVPTYPHRGRRRRRPGRGDDPPPADRHQGRGRRRRLARRRAAVIGITAGASTPNNKIGETVVRICESAGVLARAAGDTDAPRLRCPMPHPISPPSETWRPSRPPPASGLQRPGRQRHALCRHARHVTTSLAGTPGWALADTLVVEVRDAEGNPCPAPRVHLVASAGWAPCRCSWRTPTTG